MTRYQNLTPAATAAVLALALLVLPLSAQMMDPDPSESGAQQTAEARYQLSALGIMPPPVGWDCEQSIPDASGPTYTYCEPNPLLIEQQNREREKWEEYRRAREEAVRRHLIRRR